MSNKRTSPKKNKKNKALTGVFIVVALVVLFLGSFWITSLVLKANQNPILPQTSGSSSGKPTEKLTYEQMEKLLAEKEKEIAKLEEELEWYRKNDQGKEPANIGGAATQTPSAKPSEQPKTENEPTKAPEKTKTPSPTVAPSQAPTQAPTPTPEPIRVPIQAPAAGDVSNE